jgi:hypothetical protein
VEGIEARRALAVLFHCGGTLNADSAHHRRMRQSGIGHPGLSRIANRQDRGRNSECRDFAGPRFAAAQPRLSDVAVGRLAPGRS